MSNGSRILCTALLEKVMSPEAAAALIPSGVNVGMSGFTGAGYPKAVPQALARRIMDANLAGKKFKIGVWTGASTPPDELSRRIAGHVLDFLAFEVENGRLPVHLQPLQSGVGNIANAVLAGLKDGPFDGLNAYTEVIQDGMFDLMRSGKLVKASATAFSFSPEAMAMLNASLEADHREMCPPGFQAGAAGVLPEGPRTIPTRLRRPVDRLRAEPRPGRHAPDR